MRKRFLDESGRKMRNERRLEEAVEREEAVEEEEEEEEEKELHLIENSPEQRTAD